MFLDYRKSIFVRIFIELEKPLTKLNLTYFTPAFNVICCKSLLKLMTFLKLGKSLKSVT